MDDEHHNTEASTSQERTAPFFNITRCCLGQYKELVAAIRFLSTLPVPGSAQLFRTDAAEPYLIVGSAYFPLVGLLIGGLLCLLPFVVGWLLPALVLAALLVIAQVLLTGGLHLDGLMDTCDGLFAGRGRKRMLEIMRDSRVGSFGVLGGASILLLRFALFASLNRDQLYLALLLVPPVGRWTMVLAMRVYPAVRGNGLGATVRQTVTRARLFMASVLALLPALLLMHLPGVALWLAGTLCALALGAWVTRRLGGLTGDVYGAIEEVTECVCLLLVVLLRTWL